MLDGYGNPLLATTQPPSDVAPGLVVRVASSSSDGYLEPPGQGTTTSVIAAVTAVTLLSENLNRKGATIYNASNKTLYVLIGNGTATPTNYNVQMSGNSYFEVPFGFTGRISGVWSGTGGNALIGEFA
jgi:hypothetical protein